MQTVSVVVICAVVGLSVFYCLVLTCSLIFLQLSSLGRSVECILHLHPMSEPGAVGSNGAFSPAIPKVEPTIFRLIMLLMCNPKKYFQANQ